MTQLGKHLVEFVVAAALSTAFSPAWFFLETQEMRLPSLPYPLSFPLYPLPRAMGSFFTYYLQPALALNSFALFVSIFIKSFFLLKLSFLVVA